MTPPSLKSASPKRLKTASAPKKAASSSKTKAQSAGDVIRVASLPRRRTGGAAKTKKASKAANGITAAAIIDNIAERLDTKPIIVKSVFAALSDAVAEEIKKGGSVIVPGLVKIVVVHKAATSARPGHNPRTGEAITIAARPACKVIKVRTLKALKDML
jgi:DNA-binding protein HU-beta